MSIEEAKREIADILEVNDDEIIEDKELKDFDAWDSIAVLSVISLVSDNTGRFLHASEITALSTVGDLLNLLV